MTMTTASHDDSDEGLLTWRRPTAIEAESSDKTSEDDENDGGNETATVFLS